MEEIIFTKMHGAGNDYIYVNCLDSMPLEPERLAVEMSDRHMGVGADGLVLIMPSTRADFRMRMFNADGSEGRMCGNASRCIAKYVYDHRLIAAGTTTVTLETLAGIKVLHLNLDEDGRLESVTVDMGEPQVEFCRKEVECSGRTVELTSVSMGNPHAVAFIDHSPTDYEIHTLGRELETHPLWPDRSNIEFAHPIGRDQIEMRVWERGSGETLACGTGACATAVAAATLGLADRSVSIRLLGGTLRIEWDAATNHVMMTGPASTVMEGRYFRS